MIIMLLFILFQFYLISDSYLVVSVLSIFLHIFTLLTSLFFKTLRGGPIEECLWMLHI